VTPTSRATWLARIRAAAAGPELFAFLSRRLSMPDKEGPRVDERLGEGVEDVFVDLARRDEGFRARLDDTIAEYFKGDASAPADASARPVIRGLLEITGVLSLAGCSSHVRAWLSRHDAALRAEPDAILGRAALGALATLPGSADARDYWLRVWRDAPPAWQPRAFMGLRLHDPRVAAAELPELLLRARAQPPGPRALLLGMWRQPEGRTAMVEWLRTRPEGDLAAGEVRRALQDLVPPDERDLLGAPRLRRRLPGLALADDAPRAWAA
jgi:hypothetical protein